MPVGRTKRSALRRMDAGTCGGLLCDAPNRRDAKLGLGPLDQHRSSAVSGENRFDLHIGGQLAGIGFLNALINVAILSALILNLVGQQFDGQKALGACGGLGRLFDLVVERLWQAYVDGSGGHGRNAPVKM